MFEDGPNEASRSKCAACSTVVKVFGEFAWGTSEKPADFVVI
jgi:hypothetical protein